MWRSVNFACPPLVTLLFGQIKKPNSLFLQLQSTAVQHCCCCNTIHYDTGAKRKCRKKEETENKSFVQRFCKFFFSSSSSVLQKAKKKVVPRSHSCWSWWNFHFNKNKMVTKIMLRVSCFYLGKLLFAIRSLEFSQTNSELPDVTKCWSATQWSFALWFLNINFILWRWNLADAQSDWNNNNTINLALALRLRSTIVKSEGFQHH